MPSCKHLDFSRTKFTILKKSKTKNKTKKRLLAFSILAILPILVNEFLPQTTEIALLNATSNYFLVHLYID